MQDLHRHGVSLSYGLNRDACSYEAWLTLLPLPKNQSFIEHDLKTLLSTMRTPFLASEVKTLLQQLLSAIAMCHDNWILHRDLKTSNLLMNNRGQIKVADFGLARTYGEPLGDMTQLVVTLWYRCAHRQNTPYGDANQL